MLDTWSLVHHLDLALVAVGADELAAAALGRRPHRPRPSRMAAVRTEGVVGYWTLFILLFLEFPER